MASKKSRNAPERSRPFHTEDAPRELLLDTCSLIWLTTGAELREPGANLLNDPQSNCLLRVSDITAWEIAMLQSKGKISLAIDLGAWFQELCEVPRLALTSLSPLILIASHQLPGSPPNDPVDRMLIATARQHGMILVTRDRRILSYGKLGHVQVMPC